MNLAVNLRNLLAGARLQTLTARLNASLRSLTGRLGGRLSETIDAAGQLREQDLDLWRPIRLALLLGGTGVAGFMLWAWAAPLHSAVIASGSIAVESQRKVVQHLEGGIVGEMLATDGAQVKAGDLLIRLDARQAQARLSQLNVRVAALGAEMARLEAELTDAGEVALDPMIAARAGEQQAARSLALQQAQLDSARADRRHRAAALGIRAQQTLEEINGLLAQLAGREQRLALTQERLAGVRKLGASGHASRTQVAQAEGELANLEGEHGDLLARIAAARQKHGQVAEELGSLDRGWRTQAADRLQTVERDVAETREQIAAAEDVLARTEIRAPHAGTVQQLAVHTRGAVIRAGEQLMQIVPQEDALVVEAQLRPEDIEAVHAGQPVLVRLNAFNARRTPPVSGRLTEVSADRIVDPRTGVARYGVKARLDQHALASLGKAELRPGMPADVLIMREARTMLDYLLEPLTLTMERAFRER